MTKKERLFISLILAAVAVMVGLDLLGDFREGASGWHLLMEAFVALAAASGVFYLLRDGALLRRRLENEKTRTERLEKEAADWRRQAKKYLEGLSLSIEAQLHAWNLTQAEKEVAFLLLKGLSSKEIAQVRGTGEKTVRIQSAAIYDKAGLGGRSELAAFFLEDLLPPAESSPMSAEASAPS